MCQLSFFLSFLEMFFGIFSTHARAQTISISVCVKATNHFYRNPREGFVRCYLCIAPCNFLEEMDKFDKNWSS